MFSLLPKHNYNYYIVIMKQQDRDAVTSFIFIAVIILVFSVVLENCTG